MLSFKPITALLLMAMFAMAGCGTPDAVVDPVVQAAAAAEPNLHLTSSLDTTELLDTRTGNATSLANIVTGDRPLLLWYWAPD